MIHIEKLDLTYSDTGIRVLKGLDLDLVRGEFVTVIGRSGSGKSTLLDVVMGLIPPSEGGIQRKSGLTLGYVFQQPALLPWRNIVKNIALPLQIEKVGKKEREDRARDALKMVGMSFAADLYPSQLSGGMSQRVAIARALVQDPDVLLMDEPFSAIDPLLRENLNINLLKLWNKTGKTILFVTHSINEAVLISDRILILEDGCFMREFKIDLPRPRTFETPQTRKFMEKVREIHSCLPREPNRAREVRI